MAAARASSGAASQRRKVSRPNKDRYPGKYAYALENTLNPRCRTTPLLLRGTSRFLFHFRVRGSRWRSVVLCATCQKGECSKEYWSRDFRYCPI
jgi:hypothetical protein